MSLLTWRDLFDAVLAYFLSLFSTSLGHVDQRPSIWTCSVYSIPWFHERDVDKQNSAPQLPPLAMHHFSFLPSRPERRHSTTSVRPEIEKQSLNGSPESSDTLHEKHRSVSTPQEEAKTSQSAERNGPWWARQIPVRPGRDHPFALNANPQRAISTRSQVAPARRTDKARDTEGTTGTVGGDPLAGTAVYHRAEGTTPSEPPLTPYTQFSKATLDPDKPIPLPQISSWVRADAARRASSRPAAQISPVWQYF